MISLFSAAAQISNDQQTKRFLFAEAYDEQIQIIKAYFEKKSYDVADVLFDILLEAKEGEFRKNGFEPDHAHEIDQLLPLLTSLESGMLKGAEDEIEKAHGSLEILFCKKIIHDLGEDKEFWKDTLTKDVLQRLPEITDHHKEILQESVEGMERLTHYRRYTTLQFIDFTGEDLKDKLAQQLEKNVELDSYLDIFLPLMELESATDNPLLRPRVFAKWKPKKQCHEIIVTAYGASNYLDVDWTSYTLTLLRDLYDLMAKLGDRINGIATRIGMTDRDIEKFSLYLDNTEHLFSQLGVIKMALEHQYPNSPLKEYIQSQDALLGTLYKLGRFIVNHHPDRNNSGKICDPNHLHVPWLNTSALFLSEYLPRGLVSHGHVSNDFHPLIKFMAQLETYIDQVCPDENLKVAAQVIEDSVAEHAHDYCYTLFPDSFGDPYVKTNAQTGASEQDNQPPQGLDLAS